MIRLVSWNVNGIRAGIKKGFWEKVKALDLDVLGIQETKSDAEIMKSGVADHPEYDLNYHSCSMKKGYSGVATFSRSNAVLTEGLMTEEVLLKPKLELIETKIGIGIEKFDVEGRLVTTKFRVVDPKTEIKEITVINGYYPQGGRDGRIPFKIEFYKAVSEFAKKLRSEGENVLICGDLNTTVADIDLARPKENRKTTGCLPEEREALDWFLKDGFVDTFRYFYPERPDMYSYWDQITRARERNVGWRIDYWIVDEKLLPFVKDALIYTDVMGSDHCPVGVELDI
jgi:exodeoxyribonuclease III